jgi:NTE family protein
MKKITLALGGGGTKGFAHIGVIRQLQKEGYEIAAVAGTSVGGIVGALFCSGMSTEEMEEFSKGLNFQKLINRSSGESPSLVSIQTLFKLIREKIGDKHFEDLKIPFIATAVDINSGQEILLDSGKLLPALQATSAIPGLFPSVRIGQMELVDGGVLDPVPVTIAHWLAPDYPIVAVSLSVPSSEWQHAARIGVPSYVPIPEFIMHQFSQFRLSQAMKLFIDSNDITSNMIAELRLNMEKPDVILQPKVYKYSIADQIDINEAITYGEQTVIEAKSQIEAAFSVTRRVNRWIRPSYLKGTLLSEKLPVSAAANDGEQS